MLKRYPWIINWAWLGFMLVITGYDIHKYGWVDHNTWIDLGIIAVFGPFILLRSRHTHTRTVESTSEAEAVRVADLLRKGVEPVETPVDSE